MPRGWSKSNHNIRGMSLIETLMAVAIVSFVMSVTGTLIFNFFRAQTRLSAKSEANEFVAAVSKYLLSEQGCNQSLAGLPIPPITEAPFSLVGYSGYGSSAGNILGGFNVSPRIKDKGLQSTVSMKGAVAYKKTIAQVKFKMSVLNGQNTTDIRERFIEIPILHIAGIISGCNVELSVEDTCTAGGGTFTPPSTCTPATVCQFKGTAYGCWDKPNCPNTSYPSATKHIFSSSSQINSPPTTMCPLGGTPTQSGFVNYSYPGTICNKFGACNTVSNTAYFYICLQCN